MADSSSVTDPNRRTILKGAAWSVPVIAAAVALPAAAASTTLDGELQLEEFDIHKSSIRANDRITVKARIDYDRYSGSHDGPAAAAGTILIFPTPADKFGTTATVVKADGTGASIAGVSVTVTGGVTTVILNYPIERKSNYDIEIEYTAPSPVATAKDYVTTVTSFTNPTVRPVILDATSKNDWK